MVDLVFIQVGHVGDLGEIHALLQCDYFEIGLVGDRVQIQSVCLWALDHLRKGQQFGHVIACFSRQWQIPVIRR